MNIIYAKFKCICIKTKIYCHVNLQVYRTCGTEFTEFFWTFSIVLYSKKHDVSETGCFRPQVKVGEKTPTQLGSLERANLNHWTNPGPWKTPYKHPTTNFVSER
jgi:hypothetical protein